MISDSRFIIIAGTARNVGKTTLACQLIQSLLDKNTIALKFITLKKNGFKHSHHQDIKTFQLIEEFDTGSETGSEKDTMKMLRAGAQRSFMLISHEAYVSEALSSFLLAIEDNAFVIAESATLRKFLKPAKFIIVDRENAVNRKPYIKDLLPLADHFISDISHLSTIEDLLLSLQKIR